MTDQPPSDSLHGQPLTGKEPPFDSPLEGEPGDMGRWIVCAHGRMWVKWDEPLCDSFVCDHDCDDGCSMTEFPVWMRPYRCRHLSAAERRIRDIVFAESRDDDA